MFTIKYPILKANDITNGMSFSPEACIKMVEDFTKAGQPMPLQLLIQGGGGIPMGIVSALEYDEKQKVILATITFMLGIHVGGSTLAKITTPDGDRVMDYKLMGIGCVILNPKPAAEKSKIII
jgi:hypothetical protein